MKSIEIIIQDEMYGTTTCVITEESLKMGFAPTGSGEDYKLWRTLTYSVQEYFKGNMSHDTAKKIAQDRYDLRQKMIAVEKKMYKKGFKLFNVNNDGPIFFDEEIFAKLSSRPRVYNDDGTLCMHGSEEEIEKHRHVFRSDFDKKYFVGHFETKIPFYGKGYPIAAEYLKYQWFEQGTWEFVNAVQNMLNGEKNPFKKRMSSWK